MAFYSDESAIEVLLYAWRRNKVDLVRAVLNSLFRERPLFIFFTTGSIHFFGWQSIFIIIFAFILNQFVNEILGMRYIISVRRRILYGFIFYYQKIMPNYKLVKYKLSDYIDKFSYDDIEEYFFKKLHNLMGLKNVSLNEKIHIYTIDLNESNILPENVTCYSMPFFESYIFLDLPPDEASSFQRFKLLHELGHAAESVVNYNFFARNGLKIHFLFFILTFSVSDAHKYGWAFASIILFVILIGIYEQMNENYYQKLNDEITADSFALLYLSDTDILALKEDEYVIDYLNDKNLNESQNRLRQIALKKMLEKRIKNDDDSIINFAASLIYKPSFFLIFLNAISYIASALYLASYSPTKNLLILVLLSLLSGLILIIINLYQQALKTIIDTKLENHTQTAAIY